MYREDHSDDGCYMASEPIRGKCGHVLKACGYCHECLIGTGVARAGVGWKKMLEELTPEDMREMAYETNALLKAEVERLRGEVAGAWEEAAQIVKQCATWAEAEQKFSAKATALREARK